jgi:hypothetical protein
MSSLSVRDIQGIASFGNEVRIPSGSSLNVVGNATVSTATVGTLNSSNLNNVSTIRNTAGTTILSVGTAEPVLTVGATGGNLIKARNTAKWWVTAANMATIQASYGVASLTDGGSNFVTITFTTATTNVRYAVACSVDHASGLSWASQMNYSAPGNTTSQVFRFSYNDSGSGFTPRGWSAIGFGDQA